MEKSLIKIIMRFVELKHQGYENEPNDVPCTRKN